MRHTILAGMFVGAGLARCAAAAEIVAAADGHHLWFVQPAAKQGQGFELCHHSTTLDGPYIATLSPLPGKPEAMAASGDRLWLVFPPRDGSLQSPREVFTLQAQFNPAFDAFYAVPAGRLDMVQSLPGEGRLASFIATADGPMALLLPSPRAPISVKPSNDYPRVLRLSNNQWIDLALPADIDPTHSMLLTCTGAAGRVVVLLAATDGRQIHRYDMLDTGHWSASTLALDLRRVLAATRAHWQVVAAIDARAEGEIKIDYLRSDRFLPLSRLPRPAGSFALLGLNDSAAILENIGERSFTLRTIDPVTGTVAQPQRLIEQPVTATRMWQVGLIVATVGTGILLLFMVKPLIAPDSPLPRGVVLLPATRRLFALLIDLAPGALAAIVLLQCSPAELVRAPVLTFDFDHFGANLLMVLVTAAHSAVSEAWWSTTLGKHLVGGKIESLSQLPPPVWRVIVRNLVKMVVLVAPPLGLVVVLNPHMQGLQDIAGRTIVVVRSADQNGPARSQKRDAAQ
jgi:uncharacterized RDD family membrane protein YckC